MTPPAHSHDFIGEFTTSYRELARGQSQFNVYEVRRGRGDGCCAPTAATGAAIPTLPPLGPTDPRDSMLHPQESPTGVTAPPPHLWVLHLAAPCILSLPTGGEPPEEDEEEEVPELGDGEGCVGTGHGAWLPSCSPCCPHR